MPKPKEIVIDFDGTVVTHAFPEIGEDIGAAPVLKRLLEHGHKLILSTMRSDIEFPCSDDEDIICQPGKYLMDALDWFKRNDIELYGIQTNPTQAGWTTSPKCHGNLFIDDRALGCPLVYHIDSKRHCVNWGKVELLLSQQGYFHESFYPKVK